MINIYGIVATLVVISGLVFQFHYRPLEAKQDEITRLEEVRDVYEVTINDIGAKLYTAENNITTQRQQGYIDSIGEENATYDTSTLDNLFTK